MSAQFTASGTVTDADTGDPLIGVTVIVKGTTLGTVTDLDGRYTLEVPGESARLELSYVGYGSVVLDVSKSDPVGNLKMTSSTSTLDEVVVTGLATTVARRNSANSVATISAKDLTEVANPQTFEGALQGQFSGAEIKSTSGSPGGGFSVRMRGVSSIFGNQQPLYIIDGVFLDNSTTSSGVNLVTEAAGGGNTDTNQDDASNRIADIDPEDIENIEILKGAAAAAIYGLRAAGGVVIITTKRGKAGRNAVSFSQTFGTIRPITLLGLRDWDADEVEALGGQDALDVFNSGGFRNYEEELFDNTGINSTSRLEISGGNAKTLYKFGATYKNEDGIVENTGYEKASFRLNLSQKVTDWLDADISTNYIDSKADRGLFNNSNTNATIGYALAFTYPWEDLSPDANGIYPFGGAGSNVLETTDLITNREEVDRFIGGITANARLFTNERNVVKLTGTAGLDQYSLKNIGIFPQELTYFRDESTLGGVLIDGSTTSQQTNLSLFGIWSHYTSTGVSFTTTAGIMRESSVYNNVLVSGTDINGSETNVDQAANVSVNQTKRSFINKGFFAQEEVNINDKLLLTLGVRADKSQNNGDSNELYFFPKANVAVNIHEFDFWGSETVTTFKPRIAYGESMRPPIFSARFNSLSPTAIPGPGGTNSGLQTQSTKGNPDILPETQSELEFGADIGFLNDALVLSATFYTKTIDDVLLRAQAQPSTGFTTEWVNGGELENRGIEISVDYLAIQNEDFSWTTGLNWWRNRSEVTRLEVPAFTTGGFAASLGQYLIQEGLPATTLAGTIPSNADVTESELAGIGILGDAEPDFQLNWRNSFNYKTWSLDFLWHWKEGGDNINLSPLLYDFGQTTWDYDDTDLDPSGQLTNGQYRVSVFGSDARPWIEDGGYIRLRNIGLYKTFKMKYSEGKSTLKLGVSASNLINIFDYNSYDPEVSNFGGNVLANAVEVTPYPSSKRINFHLRANF
ncbi:MAG: SusC/RagA family TonB-linked outer membrane protein [Flavobacteriales bacterium]|nr:SusC/RagA family TonB-linked outer membrane protein [Flavobacteriales bacterium]